MSKNHIRVTVEYPNRAGARFDWTYYMEKHVPMVSGKLAGALLGAEVYRGIAGAGGSPPPALCTSCLTFASVAAFESAFGPHAGAIMADAASYTDISPVITIAEPV